MEVKSLDKSLILPFLNGNDEIGKIFRSRSWQGSAVGEPATWPQSLKTSLNILFDSNLPFLLLWGPDQICFYNNSYVTLLNSKIRHDEVFGRPVNDELTEILCISKNTVDDILSAKKSKETENRLVPLSIKEQRKNVSWTFHYNVVYNEGGDPGGVLISPNKVTDVEEHFYNLNISDQQFQNLVYQARVGLIVLIGEGMSVEVVNEMYAKVIGRTPGELRGKNLFTVVPETEKVFRPMIDSVRKTGKPIFLYDQPFFVFVNGEKKEGYLNIVYQPYREHDGSIIGVMVLCQDVTEQVNDKKKIIEAEAKARLAIDSADLGSYEIDLVTNEMKTSERFKKIWGVETEMPRSEYASFIHPDDLRIRDAAHREAFKTGNLEYEARIIWKDKSHHWVKIIGKVFSDSSGKPLTLIGMIQDITEQKAVADNLTRVVQERTEELQALNEELVATNEELSESNDHLVRANKELEQFAYVASHDLQEPLRKIQIFTNLLNQKFAGELSPDAASYLDKITSSANRMSNLIKDLLDYSRLTHNQSLFRKVDLNVVVSNVVTDFELLIRQKNITIRADELPTIEAIPIQMNQLFYNLVGNAIKFSKKGVKPFVAITSRVLPAQEFRNFLSLKTGRQYLEVTISDNGIGFSQEYAQQIFAIFQRLNDKSKYGGYGIGLALCRRIVDNHNGIIFAKGMENEGATFVFILPIKH